MLLEFFFLKKIYLQSGVFYIFLSLGFLVIYYVLLRVLEFFYL